ncbi:phosphopantetheine-binding protein, partial [Caballeronia sp. dw_276]|uniref:phosphopantetheine-binding protein n=1 Tax=Caballeronia sp. dw_276 TaxID=2719795 RepID=UPI001BD259D5
HSLLAGQITARTKQAFGVELPLRTVFEASDLDTYAQRIDAAVVAIAQQSSKPADTLADIRKQVEGLSQEELIRMLAERKAAKRVPSEDEMQ